MRIGGIHKEEGESVTTGDLMCIEALEGITLWQISKWTRPSGNGVLLSPDWRSFVCLRIPWPILHSSPVPKESQTSQPPQQKSLGHMTCLESENK